MPSTKINIRRRTGHLLSTLVLSAALVLPVTANAKAENQSQKMLLDDTSCSVAFESAHKVDEGFLSFVSSLANIALDQVISVVDKYLEKRKKELSATYGVFKIHKDGLRSGSLCLMIVNGEMGENASGDVPQNISKFSKTFYKRNSIKSVDSFFAFELETEVLRGDEKEGVGLLKITPYHAAFFNTSAKRQKKDYKSIVSTLTLETAHKDPKKGFQKAEIKKVFDFGKMENGTQKTKTDLKAKIIEEYVDNKVLVRPLKINITVVESEEESIYEKIVTSFYETEKENIKKTIQKIWGTEEKGG